MFPKNILLESFQGCLTVQLSMFVFVVSWSFLTSCHNYFILSHYFVFVKNFLIFFFAINIASQVTAQPLYLSSYHLSRTILIIFSALLIPLKQYRSLTAHGE